MKTKEWSKQWWEKVMEKSVGWIQKNQSKAQSWSKSIKKWKQYSTFWNCLDQTGLTNWVIMNMKELQASAAEMRERTIHGREAKAKPSLKICQKACWRLHGQVEERPLVWWEQSGAFRPSDRMFGQQQTLNITSHILSFWAWKACKGRGEISSICKDLQEMLIY